MSIDGLALSMVDLEQWGVSGRTLLIASGSNNPVDTVSNDVTISPMIKSFNRPPVHPGEILREDVLHHLGLSVSEAARRLGVSRQQLHRVLACTHPITTEMALRIGKFAGNGPGLWLRMQQAYDLWHAEHRMADELSRIRPIASECRTAT
jgi:antitoxin HigA-1